MESMLQPSWSLQADTGVVVGLKDQAAILMQGSSGIERQREGYYGALRPTEYYLYFSYWCFIAVCSVKVKESKRSNRELNL